MSGTKDTSAGYARVIGHIHGKADGPVLITTAGVHGNEPATVSAAMRAIQTLEQLEAKINGQFLALAGNLHALHKDTRFIDHDLNRLWVTERTSILEQGGVVDTGLAEDKDQQEIFEQIDPLLRSFGKDVFVADLHTTSSDGPPFTVAPDLNGSFEVAKKLPVPRVMMDKHIPGVIPDYIVERGGLALTVEGGSHLSPYSKERLEALLYLLLFDRGILDFDSFANAEAFYHDKYQLLEKAKNGVPDEIEIFYHHGISPEDRFVMKPGYENFQAVREGDVLAEDKRGPIVAKEDAMVFFPLYQAHGTEGFLLTRGRKTI